MVDYTTFTEVDVVPGRVVIDSATQMTVTALDRDEEVYVYKDVDVSVTGDFLAEGSFKVTASSGTGISYCFGYSDEIDDLLNATSHAAFRATDEGANVTIKIEDENGQSSSINISTGSDVWWTFTRVGTTLRLKLYSDQNKTSQIGGDLTLVQLVADTYLYVYGMSSFNDGGSGHSMSVIINELEQATGLVPAVAAAGSIFGGQIVSG